MSRQSCCVMCKVLCIIGGIELFKTVYQNAHVNVFGRRFISFHGYFIFSVPLLTFIKTKGKMC